VTIFSLLISLIIIGFVSIWYLKPLTDTVRPSSSSSVQTSGSQSQNAGPVGSATDRANDVSRKSLIAQIDSGLKQYFAEKGKYPTSLQDLVDSGILPSVPLDPVSKAPPRFILDASAGCVVQFTLSDGTVAAAACK
jgi:hypothetical protein